MFLRFHFALPIHDGMEQGVEVFFQRPAGRVQPVSRAHVKLQVARRFHISNAKRNKNGIPACSSLDFTHDLPRLIRFVTENQDTHITLVNRIDNRSSIIFPRRDVARSDPALDTVPFQKIAHVVGNGLVVRRMADENGVFQSVFRYSIRSRFSASESFVP